MNNFARIFQGIAQTDSCVPEQPELCREHYNDLPCAICNEDAKRGYSVRILGGRCANGSELGSGSRWHCVNVGSYVAICGAEPGRRSVGWSNWRIAGQEVTCPKCKKKLGAS